MANIADKIVTAAGLKYVHDKINNQVIVSDEQPTTNANKIWIDSTESAGVQVPTYEEFVKLRSDIGNVFSSSTTYAVGDYAIYDDELYICTTAHTGAWVAADFTKVNLADEIAELKDNIDANSTDIGNKSSLTTEAKTNLVSAINEVDAHSDANASNIGDKASLTTNNKANLVAALNEVDAHADANASEISSLKDELNGKVDLDGEYQVTPQNIQGMQFTKTPSGAIEGENIFTTDMLFEDGYYVAINPSTGTVTHGAASTYKTFCVPIEQDTKYTFTQARFALLAKGNTLGSEAVGTLQQNISEIEAGEASYLFLSYNSSNVDINNIEVHSIVYSGYVYSDFVLPDWLDPHAEEIEELKEVVIGTGKTKYASLTGSIASGGSLQLTAARTNLRKNEKIVFEGNIVSFNSLRIGLCPTTDVATDENQKNTFRIDETNVSYYPWSSATPVTVVHGLTIANNIQIIWELTATASLKVTLISNGNMFAHEFTNFVRQTIGSPYVLSIDTVLTDCKLVWTCADITKAIWMFGDSYFSYDTKRWTYYLHEYGYDQNCLLDGFPGEGGVNGRVSFNNLLAYGTPKFAVWCLGMNDTSDGESAPATSWVNARDIFLLYCTQNNVTPIFGTIPTVPTINHEQKNAWIRSSGYRYIDFAEAVGATASGTWFSGMLSSDNKHPTEQGAKALFGRVLLDFPEIMLNEID